ncbi:MAG: homoserine O-succinyltransferase [Vampirovibrionales bacterium]|nr:homoserine O-succinyltransferase [Vampirovibrionales bacterium]
MLLTRSFSKPEKAKDACRPPLSTLTALTAPEVLPEIIDEERFIALPDAFILDYGILKQATAGPDSPLGVRARLVGPAGAPVILVAGGISAGRNTIDAKIGTKDGELKTGWWRNLVGLGQTIDTRFYRVLSFDFFPDDAAAKTVGQSITPNDQARIAKLVCDAFGIQKLHAFIGASYGGMVGLGFALLFPQSLEKLVVVCAGHRPHPMGTAWRSIQRKIVRFGLQTGEPDKAVALARELGMTTYRTSREFGERFDRHVLYEPHEAELNTKRFDVENYLETRGLEFIGRMSPERYLRLSESIDLHQIDPAHINVPVTLIGCRQDQLVPVEEIRLLQQLLPKPATRYEFDSIYGHDAFLKETRIISDIISTVL